MLNCDIVKIILMLSGGWEMNTELKNAVIDILKGIGSYVSGHRDENCYLSSYQIAVLLLEDKKIKKLLSDINYPMNVGGAGDGSHNSLAQTIAKDLAKIPEEFEIAFLNKKGLHQFSFIDEKGILSEPSVQSFSMFRLKRN